MLKFKSIKKALADNSGLSLIELIIAAALITIVGAGFCSASASAHIATVKNEKSVKSRTAVVSYVDQNALKPIVTAAEASAHLATYDTSLAVNNGKSIADITDMMDASAHGGKKIDYIGWADVQLYDSSNAAIAGTKVNCAICKPIDTQTTAADINRIYFGFEVPNDATAS